MSQPLSAWRVIFLTTAIALIMHSGATFSQSSQELQPANECSPKDPDGVVIRQGEPKSIRLVDKGGDLFIDSVTPGFLEQENYVSFSISPSPGNSGVVLTSGQAGISTQSKVLYLVVYGGFKSMITCKASAMADGKSVAIDALSTFPNRTVSFTIPANTTEVHLSGFLYLSKFKRPPDNTEAWPKSVNDAVERLLVTLSPDQQLAIKNTKKGDLIEYHLGLGIYIRNTFGLWKGNSALLNDCGNAAMHPDDCSMIIIEALWKRLQAKDPNEKK